MGCVELGIHFMRRNERETIRAQTGSAKRQIGLHVGRSVLHATRVINYAIYSSTPETATNEGRHGERLLLAF